MGRVVRVCGGVEGSALYRNLKDAYVTSRSELDGAGWLVVMTNRRALGLAGAYLGGRSHLDKDTPDYHLTAADFTRSTQEE